MAVAAVIAGGDATGYAEDDAEGENTSHKEVALENRGGELEGRPFGAKGLQADVDESGKKEHQDRPEEERGGT
jgi:hypothetical protein